ncbi:ABC transporter permease [Micromonospora soli]|uniref:FtsX-like permease family protein n=1 Tax=Micromonospora sp. NBRC 110009 TaxID=3061627 RepID=UPI002672962A|nr:FtsX-like permease family protein [Micromonospora sp. NBRC 110009]WKT97587.1 ABC transporter permease [Micromonospora sp. NBRC 110009]
MFRFVWGQLRGRAGRSVALLVGVLVATTGFVVLTGATTTSRLAVTGTVERNTRAAYDILVRPKGTRTPLEAERRLVRPNYLSGLYGGITTAQYEQVKAVEGVDVAAPIAMLGYSTTPIEMPIDLTDVVDRSLDRQVIRIDRTFLAERGLTHAPAAPTYVYVTKHRLHYPVIGDQYRADAVRYTDGRTYDTQDCGLVPREVLDGGRTEPVCDLQVEQSNSLTTLTERQTWRVDTFRLLPDGRFEQSTAGSGADAPSSTSTTRLTVSMYLTVPFLLAAVDPDAEQRLIGLTDAVVSGRPLTATDTTTVTSERGGLTSRTMPVLATSRPFVDGAIRATYTRLRPGRSLAGLPPQDLAAALRGAPAVAAAGTEQDALSAYRTQLAGGLSRDGCCWGQLQVVVQTGQANYDQQADGTLRVRTASPDPDVYHGEGTTLTSLPRPWLTEDTSFRPLTSLRLGRGDQDARRWRAVGLFDPEKLTGFSDLGKVPLETYEPPVTQGADERSRAALGGKPLEPSGNPAGYLSAPPLLLTTLTSVPGLLAHGTSPQRTAPISAIRVRVTDVHGYSKQSAERVRLIAERIAQATGLDVDITLGSSPAPQTVDLPAGAFGRPELRLTENWSALGVASTITKAVDRKSAALFLLVLVVCVLFLGNAVSAAVRDRRPELAVLACLGWPARRIGALILGEVAALGLAAGLLAVGLAFPLGAALDIGVDWRRALLAVPVALLLALVAGLAPALRAARAHPAAALRPPVATARWVRRPRTLPGLALVNLVRTPGRTLLGAGALAIGVSALTLVAAAAYAFRGAIVGSLLGDTVSLSVRGADALAAVATVLLGAAAVADVLYLNIRDRAAELATLRATGWTDTALARLVGYEGFLLGALGALAGAGLGLGGAAWLVGDLPAALVTVAATVALAGVLVTCLAALVPAALLRRLPTAQLLAEE